MGGWVGFWRDPFGPPDRPLGVAKPRLTVQCQAWSASDVGKTLAVGGIESESCGKALRRLEIWKATSPAFEVSDTAPTDAGEFGQLCLRQTSLQPVSPKQ
jgi:hypothetical protein